MKLTDKQITGYQQLYRQTFGESISKDVALIQGLALVRLIKVLSNPIKKENENEKKNVNEISADKC